MFRLVPVLLAGFALAPAALPGVDRTQVPAGAQWVVHVDVAGVLGSELFGALQALEPDLNFETNSDLDEMRQQLGIDPTRDVKAVTVYGLAHDPEAVVAMIHTTSVIDRAEQKLSAMARRESIEIDGLELSRWSDPDGHGRDDAAWTYVARKAGSDARIVLVSPDADDLVAGVDALTGASPSLADAPGSIGVSANAGALVHVSASGRLAELANEQPASNLARLVRTAVVEIGESDGENYVHVEVQTASSQDAARVAQILQGAMALASLASDVEPEAQQALALLQGLDFKAEGKQLTIHLSKPTDDLLALVRGDWDHHDEADEYRAPPPERERKKKPGKSGWY